MYKQLLLTISFLIPLLSFGQSEVFEKVYSHLKKEALAGQVITNSLGQIHSIERVSLGAGQLLQTPIELQANTAFIPLFMAHSLRHLSQSVELKGVNLIYEKADQFFEGFLADSYRFADYKGTIAHFRYYEVESLLGLRSFRPYPMPQREVRHISPLIDSLFYRYGNFAEDFDNSAELCMWLLKQNHSDFYSFCSNTLESLLAFIDDDPSFEQNPVDQNWKKAGSGGVFTWSTKNNKKIPMRVNDVDCVVNLNVLDMLGTVKAETKIYDNLSSMTKNGIDKMESSICKLTESFLKHGKQNVCSPYYDGTSALWAYSKSFSKISCLGEIKELAKRSLSQMVDKSLEPFSLSLDFRYKYKKFQTLLKKNRSKTPFYKRHSETSLRDSLDVAEMIISLENLGLLKDYKEKSPEKVVMLKKILLSHVKSNGELNPGYGYKGGTYLSRRLRLGTMESSEYSKHLAAALALEAMSYLGL